PLGQRPRLRTHPPTVVLDREDVAVEGSGPLLTLHGHLEITQGVADIAFNPAPIELWVAVRHIRGTIIPELFVNADFDKFVKERGELGWVKGLAQLADQISGSD